MILLDRGLIMQSKKILVIVYKRHILIYSIILIFICTIINILSGIDHSFLPAASNIKNPRLAIIIDDFGLNRNGIEVMMSVNRHMTFAIMPFLQYSKQDAINAHKKGYEVIVHLPMQSQKVDNPGWLGPRPVKISLSDNEVKKIVSDSINAVPYSSGVNIHMGALASENKRIVTDVMKVVKNNGLYFVDSVTSPRTVCSSVAKSTGVRFAQRDIFLEDTSENKTKAYIKHQLEKAGDMACKYGYSVVIGHVGPAGGKVTAEAIKEMIPQLESKGIKLVYISELI